MKRFAFVVWASLALASPAPASIIINEIMQNPSAVSDSDGEWFELFNAGNTAVDLDGWTIRDNGIDSHLISNSGPLVISAGGFLVLARSADPATNGGVAVDYEYGLDFFLSNNADELLLFDASLVEIDRVEWDGGLTFPDPTGASMALLDASADNSAGNSWRESLATFGLGDSGTPGSCNSDVGQVCGIPVPEPARLALLGIALVGGHLGRRWVAIHRRSGSRSEP